jgi:cytochrome c oxidase assembly protein subunit 11
MDENIKRKNTRLLGICGVVMIATGIMPWAYVPVYRQVCSLVGFRTSTDQTPDQLFDEARAATVPPVSVRFMGVSGQLPIDIEPAVPQADVKIGKTFAVHYRLTNKTDRDLDFRAVHMVEPPTDGSFQLIKCFCDTHRVIKAHETQDHILTFKLTRPPEREDGLTVNYTLFDYDPKKNHAS